MAFPVGLHVPVSPAHVSRLVAFLGFPLIGFFRGLASSILGSPFLGAFALVSSNAVVGLWCHFALLRTEIPQLLGICLRFIVVWVGHVAIFK